jgi:hypothetical protein
VLIFDENWGKLNLLINRMFDGRNDGPTGDVLGKDKGLALP